jgi:hypothetical protein
MKPKLLANPIFWAGAYSLHLYCKYENAQHGFDEFPHEIYDCQTYGEAASKARSLGWILHRDNTATCPKCALALKGPVA